MSKLESDVRFEHLSDWLAWQEGLHPNAIDLGLERIRVVLQRLGFHAPTCPVITIAGTKGKGSCAATLDSMLRAAVIELACSLRRTCGATTNEFTSME